MPSATSADRLRTLVRLIAGLVLIMAAILAAIALTVLPALGH